MEQREYDIFSKNLSKYVSESGRTQLEIAKAIGVSAPTFNMWMNGKALPRIDKIQRLADYFGIDKADLITEGTPKQDSPIIRQIDFEVKQMPEDMQRRLLEYVRLFRIMNGGNDNVDPKEQK